jgi:hypothetical protein
MSCGPIARNRRHTPAARGDILDSPSFIDARATLDRIDRGVAFARGYRLDKEVADLVPAIASEHSSELIGCPISRSLATYCVRLELRSLPSPGVARLRRYYEPLRHPGAPGLSLAGVRLVIAGHASGLPVLRTLSLCTCCRQYPGVAAGSTLRSGSIRSSYGGNEVAEAFD